MEPTLRLNNSPVYLPLSDGRIEYFYQPAAERWAPTLVFLHEALGSMGLWRNFPARIQPGTGCGLLVFSRIGHGWSDPLPRRNDGFVDTNYDYLSQQARSSLPEIFARLEIKKPIIIGHGDGATIGLIYASLFPENITGLVVESPYVMIESVKIKSIKRAGKAFHSGVLRTDLAPHHADPDGLFMRWYGTWLGPNFSNWSILPDLARITAPILALQGDSDPYGTFAQITALRDHVRGYSDIVGIRDCGHTPHSEKPDLVAEKIQSFLKKIQ
jgi:pimeloyl-ACP methyl ester carboxylesterase